MPTVIEIQNALRDWVVDAVGVSAVGQRVIFAEQGAPKPARPYVDIHIPGLASRGQDEKQATDVAGVRKVVGIRTATVTIQAYGPGAMQIAMTVRDALGKETVTDKLHAAGLSFWQAQQVSNLTTNIEAQFEERAAFEATFGLAAVSTETVGVIETVEGTATYKRPDDSTARVQNYTVTI